MGTKRKYSVNVIPDKNTEGFTPSYCNCVKCAMVHAAQLEWDLFTPKTNLQRNMKNAIAKIEERIQSNITSNKIHIPKRLYTKS